MNKIKISLNILIFALIVGFGYYMVSSITKEATTLHSCNKFCGDCPQKVRCGVNEPQPVKSDEVQTQCQCKQKIKDDEND